MKKTILDACCGGKMFWFNKNHPDVLFQDNRVIEQTMVGNGKNARKFEVSPDVVGDFREMPYEDNSFALVVFDPPHLTSLGKKSYMAKKYGILKKETWKEDLTKGFNECFRVLQPNGFLIFKWNEHDIKVSEVLKCAPIAPLFGHPSGKTQKTHWICFMKNQQYLIKDKSQNTIDHTCDYEKGSNQPCDSCPKKITAFYLCNLLKEDLKTPEKKRGVPRMQNPPEPPPIRTVKGPK